MPKLEQAPATPWKSDGEPAFGTYRGECVDVAYDEWFGRIERLRRQKRWLWFGAIDDDLAVGGAIVRTGYAANVFCWAFDRTTPKFHQDVSRVLPRPAVEVASTPRDGTVARYQAIVERLKVERSGDTWSIDGRVGDIRLDLRLTEHATPMTAVCPVPELDGGVNVTRKQACASVSGTVRAGTHRREMSNAPAFVDHSHGMLAGETVWQWAIGQGLDDDGARVGFNLVASFNDGLENVVWLDGEPRFVGPVEFAFDPETPETPWRVSGEEVDLTLEVEGVRAQSLDLGVVVSDYVQPIGRWRGRLAGVNVDGVGVAEHHRSVW